MKAREIAEALASRALSVAQHLFPAGRRQGHEFLVGSLNGEPGKSLSIHIGPGERAGVWKDFASGDTGDILKLWQRVRGCDMRQAMDEAAAFCGLSEQRRTGTQASRVVPLRRAASRPSGPRPQSDPPRDTVPGCRFSAAWDYFDETGAFIMQHARHDSTRPGEGKQFRPWLPSADGKGWESTFPDPRPLYDLPGLVASSGPVLIVEGEKTADAARELLGDFTVTTWPGGAAAIGKVDFTPLAGRDVTLWPDADEPGRNCAEKLATLCLEAGARSVRIVTPPEGLPEKWDLADPLPEGFGFHQILAALDQARDARLDRRRAQGLLDLAALYTIEPPARRWVWESWLPRGHVGLLVGEGGAGKSLIGIDLSIAVITGRSFCGYPVTQGNVLGWFAEDDRDELWRRVNAAARQFEPRRTDFDRFQAYARHGKENMLCEFPKPTCMEPLQPFKDLIDQIREHRPALVILDNIAQLSGADENSRREVTIFVNKLSALALEFDCAILLLGHPSKSDDVSGSTAWKAAVRSVFHLDYHRPNRPKTDEPAHDLDTRFLSKLKANYSSRSDYVELIYRHGALEWVDPAHGETLPERVSRKGGEAIADEAVLSGIPSLAKLNVTGDYLTGGNRTRYLPKLLTEHGMHRGCSQAELHQAIVRLMKEGRVLRVFLGSPSDKTYKLVLP
jgi:hypothetical protein